MHLQSKGHRQTQFFLGILILNVSSCSLGSKSSEQEFGRQSRLISSLIPMSCDVDNLAIYNEYYAYRLSDIDYNLNNFSNKIGRSEDVFSVELKKHKEDLMKMKNPRISICENGKLYVGLPLFEGASSYPPESHFCFRYDSLNTLKISEEGKLYLGSVKYISQNEYDQLMTYE